MSFEGIVQIATVDGETSANQYLEKGWELLAITPGKETPLYTLGRRAKKEPVKTPAMARG